MALKYTPVNEIAGLVKAARTTFNGGKTKSIEWRRQQLKQILALVEENIDSITEALKSDLRRPDFECVSCHVHSAMHRAS